MPESIRVLVLLKAYPAASVKYSESVCGRPGNTKAAIATNWHYKKTSPRAAFVLPT